MGSHLINKNRNTKQIKIKIGKFIANKTYINKNTKQNKSILNNDLDVCFVLR